MMAHHLNSESAPEYIDISSDSLEVDQGALVAAADDGQHVPPPQPFRLVSSCKSCYCNGHVPLVVFVYS